MKKIFAYLITVLIISSFFGGCVKTEPREQHNEATVTKVISSEETEITEENLTYAEPYTHATAWEEFNGIWVQENGVDFVYFSMLDGGYCMGYLFSEGIIGGQIEDFTDSPKEKAFKIQVYSPAYENEEIKSDEIRFTATINYSKADEKILSISNGDKAPVNYYYAVKGFEDIETLEQIKGILKDNYKIS